MCHKDSQDHVLFFFGWSSQFVFCFPHNIQSILVTLMCSETRICAEALSRRILFTTENYLLGCVNKQVGNGYLVRAILYAEENGLLSFCTAGSFILSISIVNSLKIDE